MLSLIKSAPTPGALEIRDQIQPAAPERDEILVRVAACGICGTDLHIHRWVPWAAQRITVPRILGHEIAGTVATVGPGVEYPKPGDSVSIESHIWCGRCYQCHTDRPHLCANLTYPGIDRDGGLAEYVVVPARTAWVHDPPLESGIAAMFEPFALAVHACSAGVGVCGQNVLVTGCGPIGLMCVSAARAMGATSVIATDISPVRLNLARTLGADRVIDVAREDLRAAVKDVCKGRGADVVIECSGSESALASGFELVCAGGELRLVGAYSQAVSTELGRLLLKGVSIHAIHGRRIFSSWELASRLVQSGKVNLAPLISHTLPLSEGIRAFEMLEKGAAAKILIAPGQ
jgi:threonine 3-dehydrogenase